MSCTRFVSGLCALWLLGLSTVAGGASADAGVGMLDRAAALAAAVSTNQAPDADTVLLAGLQRIRYEADGTSEQWHEEYIQILTEKGRRDYLTLSSYFVIPYQRGPEDCQIPLVEIIHAAGGTTVVDVAAQSRIMINPSSMEANIYNPNEKLIEVNVGGLQVGDILHFVMFDRVVQARMADSWGDWFVLESTRPMVSQTIEIDGPTNCPLAAIALKDPLPGRVTASRQQQGDRIHYRWEVRDVPRMFPEPNMPELHTVVQRLLVSTIPDWETVSRWYWRLSEPHFARTPAIEEKVAALTADAASDAEKIQALFGFVAQEIRYMGIIAESEAPGYEPHDVGDTFAARHGVCRDKAALLVSMLRAAGFESFPVLIHTGARKDPEVPQPAFNHAIVAVRTGEGYQLMDPTDETTKDLLPAYLHNRSYLVASPEGDPLRLSPVAPATNNLMRVETRGYVDGEGRLTAETQLYFDGVNDNAYRGYFAQIQPQERRRLLEGALRAAMPGARVDDVEILPADLMDMSSGLTARVVYEAEDILLRGGDLAMLPLPFLGTRLGMVNFILGQTGLQERRYPLETDVACGVREQVTLELSPAFNTPESMPLLAPVNTNTVSWSMAVRQSGLVLDAQSEFLLDAVSFSAADYRGLKAVLVDVERALRRMPIYSMKAAAGDALTAGADSVVEDETAKFVLDADGTLHETRTVRRRILTYAGKKQYSELAIPFNPAWGAVELVRGVVTAPDGKVSEISRAEINEMDAEWAGSTPRYPSGRTLVASFPAVVVGGTIEYTLAITRRDRPLLAVRESFASAEAIRRKHVTVSVPRGWPVTLHRNAFEGRAISEAIFADGGRALDTYEWTVTDVPATRREEQTPPDWLMQPTVSVSFGTWAAYAGTVSHALEQAATKQPACEAEGRRLAQATKDPWALLQQIRDLVALRVRLAGPTFPELPLSAITRADVTLSDGYGSTADRAVVLYALARAAGFEPEFVLASRRPAIEPLRRSLDAAAEADVLPDVLVRVTAPSLNLAAGHHVYLGDSDQYGAIGASGHEDMWALTLPRGEIVAVLPAREDRIWTEHRISLDAQGNALLTHRTLYFGNSFGNENRRYQEMTPEERRRYHQERLAKFSQGAVAEGPLRTDFSGYPGQVEFTVRLPAYGVRDGDYLYVALPETFDRLFALRSDRRALPLFLDVNGVWKTQCRLDVPAGFEVVMAPPARRFNGVANTSIELSSASERTDGVESVVLQGEVFRAPAIVDPGDYPRLVEWDRTLSHRRARTIVLRLAPAR
jgi:transglutaminase-like putative cysteine protease